MGRRIVRRQGTKNEQLMEDARQAITNVFSDRSVSRGDCRANLKSLIGDIDIMLEALDMDDQRDEEAAAKADNDD